MNELDDTAANRQTSLNKKQDIKKPSKMIIKEEGSFNRKNQDMVNIDDSIKVNDNEEELDRVAAQIKVSLDKKKEKTKVAKEVAEEPEKAESYFDSEDFEEDSEESSEEII